MSEAANPAESFAAARARCGWSAFPFTATAVVLCLLALTAPTHATDHALLVGVADYPNLPRRLWLRAPPNDVALMRETLLARGADPARIRQLVSRSGAANEPTRRNIVEALQNLREQVRPGDSVLLYLAGHGSQQPQPSTRGARPVEGDGLDEVFLPADVQRWDGSTAQAAIPNAVLDDEFAEWMDALVDRGATVWAIFDTCHAAGMARGGRASGVRAVSAAELGVPGARDARHRAGPETASERTAPSTTPSTAASTAAKGRTDGRAFAMAARKHEGTFEEWLPRGAPLGHNRLHGVFTYHVVQVLKAEPRPTLRDLERAVRAAYAREQRIEPTPQFLGDAALRWR